LPWIGIPATLLGLVLLPPMMAAERTQMAKLLLFDPELKAYAPFVGKTWSIDPKEQQSISSLKELGKAIGQHKQIDELVLFFHGFPGGITLGSNGYSLSDADLRSALPKNGTKIPVIRFEGCWVGERPDEMAQFGTIFGSSQVSGFTWEGVKNLITVTIPRGATAATAGQILKRYERWLGATMPSAADLAALARHADYSKPMLLEWWQAFVIEMAPPYETPKGQTKTNFERLGSHGYKRRSEAGARTVKARDTEESSDPISAFEYVTVTFGP
jgi:hypothetical protein